VFFLYIVPVVVVVVVVYSGIFERTCGGLVSMDALFILQYIHDAASQLHRVRTRNRL